MKSAYVQVLPQLRLQRGDIFLVTLPDLDYNGRLINEFRRVLQDIHKDENIRVLERTYTNKNGVGKGVYKIEICSSNGLTQEYMVTSSGKSNKSNRLTIEKTT